MFAQISTATTTTAGIAVAIITGIAAVAKNYLSRKPPKPDTITRAEFHDGLDNVRDRIAASYLALAEKIEQQHNQVLTTLDHQGAKSDEGGSTAKAGPPSKNMPACPSNPRNREPIP